MEFESPSLLPQETPEQSAYAFPSLSLLDDVRLPPSPLCAAGTCSSPLPRFSDVLPGFPRLHFVILARPVTEDNAEPLAHVLAGILRKHCTRMVLGPHEVACRVSWRDQLCRVDFVLECVDVPKRASPGPGCTYEVRSILDDSMYLNISKHASMFLFPSGEIPEFRFALGCLVEELANRPEDEFALLPEGIVKRGARDLMPLLDIALSTTVDRWLKYPLLKGGDSDRDGTGVRASFGSTLRKSIEERIQAERAYRAEISFSLLNGSMRRPSRLSWSHIRGNSLRRAQSCALHEMADLTYSEGLESGLRQLLIAAELIGEGKGEKSVRFNVLEKKE